jgi:hypothetical protein
MHVSAAESQRSVVQEPVTLHILSNFAAGQTLLRSFWQEQIASLRHEAHPFQVSGTEFIPTIILDTTEDSNALNLLRPTDAELQLWPNWCTFFTLDQRVSESFLLVSIIKIETIDRRRTHQSQRLVLQFKLPQQLELLESIERAGKLVLRISSTTEESTIVFDDRALTLHLDHIRPLFR